jgi:transcriptional regulator with XRE-family HTH domain
MQYSVLASRVENASGTFSFRKSYEKLAGMDADAEVGKRVAELRRQKDLRQEDFLELLEGLGVSWTQATLSRVEGGKRALKATELFAVADALGIGADKLNPQAGTLPYAIHRQREKFRAQATRAKDYADFARQAKEALLALLLTRELLAGNTTFVVHGRASTFLLALAEGLRSSGEDGFGYQFDKIAISVLGLDQGDLYGQIESLKKQFSAPAVDKFNGAIFAGLSVPNGPEYDAIQAVNRTYEQLLEARFPGLKFEDAPPDALTVEGLDVGNAG